MNIELQKRLFNQYHKIFIQRTLPPNKSCMCFGIECGDGWYKLINVLCKQLQFDIDKNNQPQLEAIQIKEKFGGLRFYVNHATERQNGMIDFAENISMHICEECGSMQDIVLTEGYIRTLCKKCKEKL